MSPCPPARWSPSVSTLPSSPTTISAEVRHAQLRYCLIEGLQVAQVQLAQGPRVAFVPPHHLRGPVPSPVADPRRWLRPWGSPAPARPSAPALRLKKETNSEDRPSCSRRGLRRLAQGPSHSRSTGAFRWFRGLLGCLPPRRACSPTTLWAQRVAGHPNRGRDTRWLSACRPWARGYYHDITDDLPQNAQ